MRTLIRRPFSLLILIGLFGPNPGATEEASLRVTSSVPDIDVTARATDRSPIRLPKLPYEFSIEAECRPGQSPRSLLLSIADTRKRISADKLQVIAETAVTVTIPARQIAPLTVDGYCVVGEGAEKHRQDNITINGALSAQAALLCANGNDEQMIYASLALDVTLHCIEDILDK